MLISCFTVSFFLFFFFLFLYPEITFLYWNTLNCLSLQIVFVLFQTLSDSEDSGSMLEISCATSGQRTRILKPYFPLHVEAHCEDKRWNSMFQDKNILYCVKFRYLVCISVDSFQNCNKHSCYYILKSNVHRFVYHMDATVFWIYINRHIQTHKHKHVDTPIHTYIQS